MKPKRFGWLVLLMVPSTFAIPAGNPSHSATTSRAAVATCHANTPIRSLILSPDGKFLLGTWNAGTARLWDFKTGAVVQTFSLDSKALINKVTFSPDGKYVLASVHEDGDPAKDVATLWDANTGKKVRTFTIANGPPDYPHGPIAA